MHLRISSSKWQTFYLGLNVLDLHMQYVPRTLHMVHMMIRYRSILPIFFRILSLGPWQSYDCQWNNMEIIIINIVVVVIVVVVIVIIIIILSIWCNFHHCSSQKLFITEVGILSQNGNIFFYQNSNINTLRNDNLATIKQSKIKLNKENISSKILYASQGAEIMWVIHVHVPCLTLKVPPGFMFAPPGFTFHGILPLWMRSPDPIHLHKIIDDHLNYVRNMYIFVVSAVPADGLAPSGARISAGYSDNKIWVAYIEH